MELGDVEAIAAHYQNPNRVLVEMREQEAKRQSGVKYHSPGRRAFADSIRGYQPGEPSDPTYRRLLGVYVRAKARIDTLPPQARSLRALAYRKQQAALNMMKSRLQEIGAP